MSLPDEPGALLVEALRGVLTQVGDPIQVLRTVLDQAVARTGADRGVFVEVLPGGELQFGVLHRMQRRELTGHAGEYSRSIFAEVLRTGRGTLVGDAMQDPRFMARESIQDLRVTSVLCLPIHAAGSIAALVFLESSTPGKFTKEHQQMLGTLLEMAGPVLEAMQAGRRLVEEREQLRQEVAENRDLLTRDWSFGRFIGRSPAVRELEETIRKAARVESTLLFLGETGTGKSILARILHHSGSRAKNTLVTVFCPSLGKDMVEAELFGHRKGAFTGAVTDRIGKVQAAEKGTLFLDEIGELPLEIQPKLLRLLQEKTYERVGDAQERRADVRVIGATNRDLEDEVRAGRFRRDLFERLNFIPIRVPPLRERKQDIPLLLRHCLDQHETARWREVTPDAAQFLVELDFAWPGNVRHVEQLAARLAMEERRDAVTRGDVERHLGHAIHESSVPAEGDALSMPLREGMGWREFLESAEEQWLRDCVRRYRDLTRADLAKKLGVSEALLYKKLKQYRVAD